MELKSASSCVASFVDEYKGLVESLGPSLNDEKLRGLLMKDSEWSEQGSAVLILLARRHGTFVLANALALAEALGIEDGEAGL